jgi:hypothetical protein
MLMTLTIANPNFLSSLLLIFTVDTRQCQRMMVCVHVSRVAVSCPLIWWSIILTSVAQSVMSATHRQTDGHTNLCWVGWISEANVISTAHPTVELRRMWPYVAVLELVMHGFRDLTRSRFSQCEWLTDCLAWLHSGLGCPVYEKGV